LAADIVARHPIPGRNVVGHSDVAHRRRMEPGELFDWPRLAAAGIGLWPEESAGFTFQVQDLS
jgi:N-acetylmuramoyl-L-alanine amidase